MVRSRKSEKEKMIKAIAGLFLIGLGMLWLNTGNSALILGLFVTFIILMFGVILFLSLNRREKLKSSGIAEIDQMSGTTFELLLLEYFKKLGYRGKLTSEYADYGADLLLLKDNVRYVVQAKRWNQKVGVKAVQEVVAAIKHYNANAGILITNNYFTENAIKLAKSNGIELWDRGKLLEVMSEVKAGEFMEDANKSTTNFKEGAICPSCGSKLVLRKGSRGRFIGCSGFPRCRYSRDYIDNLKV